jgi:signal transduction histidine kinase
LRAFALAASYALAGGLGMLTPIHLAPGFFFDLRAAVVGLAVLFAGPLPGLLVALGMAGLRLALGGGGAWVGVGAIAVAYVAGLVVYLRFGAARRPTLVLLGIAEGAASAIWLTAMLSREMASIRFVIAQGVAVALSTILIGLALRLDAARRSAELDAVQARDIAERANQAKNVFLAHMSHELRTPLNAVIGFAESLQLDALARDPERVREYGAHIAKAGNHLRYIVADLLDLARIETGRLELQETDFDPLEMLESVVAAVTPQAERAGLRFEVHCDLDGGIHGDPHRLAQVLINLAANAVEATNVGSVLVSCSFGAQNEIQFHVTDSGTGIPGEAIPGLLRPFNQRGSALVRRKEGSVGIGLPLSRALVELHGGQLTIDSTLGAGTVATVILPASRRRVRAAAA